MIETQTLPPYIVVLDAIVRIIGFPTLLGVLVWVVRTWDKNQDRLVEIDGNTKLVKAEVAVMKTNHLAHLQTGIDKVAESNDNAVELLRTIDKNIEILADRFPRV